MEPLVGYRAWAMRSSSPNLFGVFHNVKPWEVVKATEAECRAYAHTVNPDPLHFAPAMGCTCGLHARTTLEGLLDEYPNYPKSNKGRFGATSKYAINESSYKTLIFGAVLMWGVILRGDLVIRAQFARPICFTTLPHKQQSVHNWDELATNVSETYSVPIISWEHMRSYAAEFGEMAP